MDIVDIGTFRTIKRQLRVFFTSVAIVMWFYSVTGLLRYVTKGSESPSTFLGILALALLYLGMDGDITELVGVHGAEVVGEENEVPRENIGNTAAAVAATTSLV